MIFLIEKVFFLMKKLVKLSLLRVKEINGSTEQVLFARLNC